MTKQDRPSKNGFRRAFILLAVGAVALGGYAYRYGVFSKKPATAAASQNQAAAAPVHVQAVERKNFPLTLSGLGTVQALNSVTIKTRVDGQVASISFTEGQLVHEGDPLVKIDPAPFQAALNQASAKLAQDQATLTNAKQDLQRTQTLTKNGYAALQLLDQRVAAVSQNTALLQVDAAAIEAAKVQLAYTDIVAPITGRVGFRLIDKGNIVHAADATGMLTINQTQPIAVVFTAPEQQLPAISSALKNGAPAVQAFTSNGMSLLGDGTLKLFDNQVDQSTGSVKLKAEFANADDAFWPGLSVSTKLRVGELKNVIVVADTSVQRGPNGLFVYMVGQDDKAVLRPVKVGQIANGLAVIEDGLTVGDRIVTTGQYRVVAGARLQILPPEAAPATPGSVAAKEE